MFGGLLLNAHIRGDAVPAATLHAVVAKILESGGCQGRHVCMSCMSRMQRAYGIIIWGCMSVWGCD